MAKKSWRCFHCDELFTSRYRAQVHFGHDDGCEPACIIVGAAGSIIERLREAEIAAADAWFAIHNETTDAAKAFHAQASRHQRELIAAEELGYERGLRDARQEPEMRS